MRYLAALLLFGASALSAQKAAQAQPSLPTLNYNDLSRITPTVRMITAEPASLTLKVGQTISLDSIKVTVIDSMGHVLGRLSGYDFVIQPNEPASAIPRKITGVRPGTTELTVRYPRNAWKPRMDPRAEAKVKVVVKP